MKKAFFLILILTSFVYAKQIELVPYIHTIKDIQYKEDGALVFVLIELSNGSVWKWIPAEYSEHLLRKWEKGDEVWLRDSDHPGFMLYNPSKPRFSPLVTLVTKSQSHLLEIDELATDGSFLVLSDGSNWRLQYDFQNVIMRQWQIGDLIFPTKYGREDYELINLDIPHDPRRVHPRYVNALLQFQSNTTEISHPPSEESFEDIFGLAEES